MAPPKCFFKRPEEFYATVVSMMQPPNQELYSGSESPMNFSMRGETSMTPIVKNEMKQLINEEPPETALDLSCKYTDPGNTEIMKQLSHFLFQHQQQLTNLNQTLSSNHYLNIDRLFSQLPQQHQINHAALYRDQAPKVYITPPFNSNQSYYEPPRTIDPLHLTIEKARDQGHRLSPQNLSESARDNSSSEASSGTQQNSRQSKRKGDGKVLRPFKLYKGNDSQGVMEALGMNEEDEEWLKTVVQYKNVDDVFLFLTNCMNDNTKPPGLTDDIIEKIQTKFGHIFQNCNSTVSNPKMIRHPDMTPKELKTDEYWEKRRKNNDAAKRSREARRHKEDGLNKHCENLQYENDCLRKEIELIKLAIDEVRLSKG